MYAIMIITDHVHFKLTFDALYTCTYIFLYKSACSVTVSWPKGTLWCVLPGKKENVLTRVALDDILADRIVSLLMWSTCSSTILCFVYSKGDLCNNLFAFPAYTPCFFFLYFVFSLHVHVLGFSLTCLHFRFA